MAEGIGGRLAELRAWHALSLREMAAQSSISYTDLLRAETDTRRPVPSALLLRLADFFHTTPEYLRGGEEPPPARIREAFMRYYDRLGPSVREGLKFATIQERIEMVIAFLERSFPGVLGRNVMAARLGFTQDALEAVLKGMAPLESHLLRLLASQTGLPQDFLIRGDFFGGAAPVDTQIAPQRLHEYYEAVQTAVASGISPTMLKKAVALLALRDEER